MINLDKLFQAAQPNKRAGKVKVKAGIGIVFVSLYLTEGERDELGRFDLTETEMMEGIKLLLGRGFNIRITPSGENGFTGVTFTHTSFTYKGKSIALQGEGKSLAKAFKSAIYKYFVVETDDGMELTEGVNSEEFDIR